MAQGWKYGKTPALVVLLLVLSVPALAAERVALVIGNASYAHAPRLANPLNDAADVGGALTRLGFEVERLDNADKAGLEQALHKLSQAAAGSRIALVFYAGHGIEVGKRNFLVPVGARLASEQDVEFETVSLDLVMRAVGRASGVGLVILDACRDNPFVASMRQAQGTRSIGRGLGRVKPVSQTLVWYAAEENQVALDGKGRNSPFSAALLAHMETPGLEVMDLFREVRDTVLASTTGDQEPFMYGSMSKEKVYLTARATPAPGPSTAAPALDRPGIEPVPDSLTAERLVAQRLAAERELLFWESVKDSTNPADIQAYLERYPGGTYEVLARNRLEASRRPEEPAAAPETTLESAEDRLGLSRAELRLIQLGLSATGHEPGKADGLIGARTRAALRQWQASRGEAATGYLDVESAKILLAAGEQPPARRVEADRLRLEREGRQRAEREAKERAQHEAERQRREEVQARAQREAEARRLAEERRRQQEWKRLGLVMVRVDGGSFTMGCQRGRDWILQCYGNEKPAHRVQIRSFEISRYEVTQGLWEAVMGDNPSYFTGCVQCPVEQVSWSDAQGFLRKLNELTGERYRLPTEAEWEFAARGGRLSRGYLYAGGNELDSVGWYNDGNSKDQTRRVGRKQKNELGLFDMSGNIEEWVQDCWNRSYRDAPDDGRAWEQGDCSRRVARGGSWRYDGRWGLRSAYRNRYSPGTRSSYLGFRLARTPVP